MTLNERKGPFLTLAKIKGPILAFNERKGPFLTQGSRREGWPREPQAPSAPPVTGS